jgi:hypothetical protein
VYPHPSVGAAAGYDLLFLILQNTKSKDRSLRQLLLGGQKAIARRPAALMRFFPGLEQ